MTQVEHAKDVIKKLLAKNTEITAAKDQLSTQLSEALSTVSNKNQELDTLKNSIKDLNNKLSKAEQSLSDEQSQAASMRQDFESKLNNYQALEEQIENLEKLLEGKDKELVKEANATSKLTGSMSAKDTKITELENELKLSKANTVSKSEYEYLEASYSDLRSNYEHCQAEKNRYCDEIVKCKNNLKDSNDQNAILVKENNELINKISEIEKAHAKEVSVLKERLKDLENIPSHTVEIEQLIKDKQDLQTRNAELEALIVTLKNQVRSSIVKPEDLSEKKYYRFGHVSDKVMQDVNKFLDFLYEGIDDDWKGPYNLKPVTSAASKAGLSDKAADTFIQRLSSMTLGNSKIIYSQDNQYISSFSKSVIYKYINEIVM